MLNAVKNELGYGRLLISTIKRPIIEDKLIPLLTDHRLVDAGNIYALDPQRSQTPLIELFINTINK